MGGLVKQTRSINFSGPLDTKSDPFQLQLGAFTSLVNCIFTEGGLLTKRNGNTQLASLPYSTSEYLTTYNQGPIAVGPKLQAYSSASNTWNNQGTMTPMGLGVLPIVRRNTSQSQVDTAISPNGLVCVAYTDQNPTALTTNISRYSVLDSTTGQVITPPTTIANADPVFGSPRVFALGVFFIIVFARKVSTTYHLQYIAISSNNPSSVLVSATDISTTLFSPSTTLAFDGAVLNNSLFLAWNAASSAGIAMTYISSNLALGATTNPDASHSATIMSVCADAVNSLVYATYYNSSGTVGYTLAVNAQLHVVLAATQVIPSGTVLNLTSTALSGILTFLYEVSNNYSYDSAIPSHYVNINTCTQAGTVGSATTITRGVGLASKSFLYLNNVYWLSAYQSPYQPTYFLMNSSGQPILKLAYGNGGGYLPVGLPSVTSLTSEYGLNFYCGYLFKDLIQAVNKNTNVAAGVQVAGIYAQLGINLAEFSFSPNIISAEIGKNLNMTGGFVWSFDGSSPVEQGFFVWPDSVQATWLENSVVTPTGTTVIGSSTIITLSANTGIAPGMSITGTGIPAGTTVLSVGTTTLLMSAAATGNHTTESLSIQGNVWSEPDAATTANAYFYQCTYEWGDNAGNLYRSSPSIPLAVTTTGSAKTGTITVHVPTLRLSYKTNVKICVYRWSVAQQIYYQVTSIVYPTMNSATVDSIDFVDTQTDAQILGNNILYTTGGTVENIGPPSFTSLFIFDDRLFGITSEDENNTWFTNQIIEGVELQFSDLLTYYVAPNIGAQGNTGPLLCGAAMDDKGILFKESAIYYMNGTGPDATGNNSQFSQPQFITSTVGCSNQKSIIFQPQGLMFEFQSEGGNQIWILGRDLSTRYIGADVEEYTSNATVESAINIPGTNQVRFTLSSGVRLMYDYYYNKWATALGASSISSVVFQGLELYLDQFGRVFQETSGVYLDGSNPVLMSFQTGWLNLAGLQGYLRAYYFFLLGTYKSPHKLQMQIAYDYNPVALQNYFYSPNNYNGPYGTGVYGSGVYGGVSALEQTRNNFQKQKCQSFQITINEIYDPSLGVPPGEGLTLSGINLVYGVKKGYPKLGASQSVG